MKRQRSKLPQLPREVHLSPHSVVDVYHFLLPQCKTFFSLGNCFPLCRSREALPRGYVLSPLPGSQRVWLHGPAQMLPTGTLKLELTGPETIRDFDGGGAKSQQRTYRVRGCRGTSLTRLYCSMALAVPLASQPPWVLPFLNLLLYPRH